MFKTTAGQAVAPWRYAQFWVILKTNRDEDRSNSSDLADVRHGCDCGEGFSNQDRWGDRAGDGDLHFAQHRGSACTERTMSRYSTQHTGRLARFDAEDCAKLFR